jgi:lysophospholipase L1-like esterase
MKVVLIGDSIRMGYQPLVTKKLEGRAEVWGPAQNSRHSLWALDHFPEWVANQKPDLVHVNFGIHDASIQTDGEHQVLLDQYRLCLKRFIARVKALGNARMIWATTTPLFASEEGVPMARWKKIATAEIDRYNAAALEIVNAEGLRVNDLHEAIMKNGVAKCLAPDGCHMTAFGNEVLSDAVVGVLSTFL